MERLNKRVFEAPSKEAETKEKFKKTTKKENPIINKKNLFFSIAFKFLIFNF